MFVFCQAIHESGSFNAQELSIIFWSLAKLQHAPPAKWVAHLLREGLEVAGGMQAQSLVLLLGSVTRWNLPEMHTAGHYRCGTGAKPLFNLGSFATPGGPHSKTVQVSVQIESWRAQGMLLSGV